MDLKYRTLKIGLILLINVNILIAQEFQGKAYYESKTEVQVGDFQGRNMNENQKKQFVQLMKDFFQKDYVLTFNKSESIYKEDESLESPGASSNIGNKLGVFLDGPQYKDVKSNLLLQEQEFLGKQFLIQDSLPKLDWKLEAESKQIGKYTCFRATAIKKADGIDWKHATKGHIENDLPKSNEILVTAWYAIDIPINQGPSIYWGLPGLILEINADRTTLTCTKIVMNLDKIEDIEKPSKGEIVRKLEYDEIIQKKLEEMKNVNNGRRVNRKKN